VMGRRLPVETLLFIHHPVIYLSFFAAGLAASMAIITALCSGFGRKPATPPPTLDPTELPKESDTSPTSNSEDKDNNNENENENEKEKLPLPPALQQLPKDPFISDRMKRVTSERRAPLSLSIKMPRSVSVARNWDHKDHREDKIKGPKLKAEDSVWMKTIILGEKCVPDAEDDPVIFEGRGKRISAYHTKRHNATAVPTQPQDQDDADVSSSSPPPLPLPENPTQDEQIISKKA